jgi:hypothetical protein
MSQLARSLRPGPRKDGLSACSGRRRAAESASHGRDVRAFAAEALIVGGQKRSERRRDGAVRFLSGCCTDRSQGFTGGFGWLHWTYGHLDSEVGRPVGGSMTRMRAVIRFFFAIASFILSALMRAASDGQRQALDQKWCRDSRLTAGCARCQRYRARYKGRIPHIRERSQPA